MQNSNSKAGTADEDNNKSQIEIRLPEQMPHRITNVHCYSVRPNIAKPHVELNLR